MGEKIRIIVAEDIKIMRENLVEILTAEKDMVVVGEASSGEQVVELVEKVACDIVLLDIDMETGTAGIEAARQILTFNTKVKLIFLTVQEDEDIIIDAMGVGAADYVTKTLDCKNVIEHIRHVMKGKIVLETMVQKILNNEFFRMKRNQQDSVDFIKKIMLLTQSENQIIACLLKGMKVNDIAESRYVEVVTIKKQITNLLRKMNCRRTKELTELLRFYKIEDLF